jgi:hypothetical protein
MKHLPLLLLLISCSTDTSGIPDAHCKDNFGKLIDTRHFREQQEIKLMYVSECGDTITNQFKINEQQLSTDNGISFYVNNFSVGEYYCEN